MTTKPETNSDELRAFEASCVRVGRRDNFSEPIERAQDPAMMQGLHCVLGLVTEVGEIADIYKRALFYGTEIDRAHLVEEFGDTLWYLFEGLQAVKSSLSEAMQKNEDKLAVRYGEKFTEDAAVERDLDAEGKVLGK